MRRSGITLVELIIVMVIGGVLASLALPRLARLRDASAVRGALSDLGATFGLARQAAVARRANVAVVFDTASGTIVVRGTDGTLARRNLRAAYGVVVGANRDSAVYDPRGLGFGVSNVSVSVRRGLFVDTFTMSRLGRTAW
jgi:prepilin-type N-terminal cleavage/methylation domain-containing protein